MSELWIRNPDSEELTDDANTAPSETDASESKSPPKLLLQTANTTT